MRMDDLSVAGHREHSTGQSIVVHPRADAVVHQVERGMKVTSFWRVSRTKQSHAKLTKEAFAWSSVDASASKRLSRHSNRHHLTRLERDSTRVDDDVALVGADMKRRQAERCCAWCARLSLASSRAGRCVVLRPWPA